MGFVRMVYAYCDGHTSACDYDGFEASSGSDTRYPTIKDYKASLAKVGWVFRGQKAYCPYCWQDVKVIPKDGD